ncbi:DUF5994 family protein [Nocardia sp. NPDC001965]
MRSRTNEIRRQDWSTQQVRLELAAAGVGNADDVWWPHSRDLVAELTGLLPVLRPALGPVGCVVFHRDEWTPTPRELISGGLRTRLDGYRHMPARTVDVIGVGATLTLRLITPVADIATNAAQPHSIREDGAGPDIDTLLRARYRRGR